MPRVNANADDYAASRVGIFFPANNQTPADGNLTGQCVTLIKWFLSEMTEVPNPFMARGDARYMGDSLVAQGHAIEVPYEQRQRGDIAVYKYGTYGHILLVLSGDRVFEQNANVSGVARRLVGDGQDTWYVYAARIGSLNESWRSNRPNIYRIKSYKEQGSDKMIIQNADNWYGRCNKTHWLIRGRELGRDIFNGFVGKDFLTFVEVCSDDPEADMVQNWQTVGKMAVTDKWDKQIFALQDEVKALGTRPTKDQLDAVQKQATDLTTQLTDAKVAGETAQRKVAELEAEHINAQKTGNAFLQWLGEQLNKILGKA
jgi:hypothetical protein